MPARSAKFGLSVVGKLKERLVHAPDREVAEVSKQGVIDRLIPELRALHDRGYTWHSIAGLLAEEGVQISGTALGAYVRRGSSTVGATKKRSKQKGASRPSGTTAPDALSLPAAPRSATGRPAVASEGSPPPRRPEGDPPVSDPETPTLGTICSSFIPRRRSEDI